MMRIPIFEFSENSFQPPADEKDPLGLRYQRTIHSLGEIQVNGTSEWPRHLREENTLLQYSCGILF